MKRFFRILIFIGIAGVFGYTLYYLWQKSQKDPVVYDTAVPFYTDITKKSVATGSIIPREEVDVKPQVSGIIKEVYVEAGDEVSLNQELARIQVIPDMVALNNAQNRLERARLSLKNARIDYDRNKKLYDRQVIAANEYQGFELAYNNARQELEAAQDNLQIVQEGATKKAGRSSLTVVKATIAGMVLDVPVKVGNQVIREQHF
ncbi:MAG: efflux RND transporter periplasmic adaptor subunit [Owenweeksia sp.]|nr:efflux RND transporter periplasmic adaptor subunit [Owenweeksia sp.]